MWKDWSFEESGQYSALAPLSLYIYHPQMKFAKVMFLHMSVCPQMGSGIPVCLAGLGRGGVCPSIPCRFPGPHLEGSMRGLAGGVLQAQTRWFPGPNLGGLQSHTQGVSRPIPRGGVGVGGFPAHTVGEGVF